MFLAVVSFLLRGMMVVLLLALLIAKTGQPFRWLLLPCGQRTRLQTRVEKGRQKKYSIMVVSSKDYRENGCRCCFFFTPALFPTCLLKTSPPSSKRDQTRERHLLIIFELELRPLSHNKAGKQIIYQSQKIDARFLIHSFLKYYFFVSVMCWLA